MLTYYLQPFFKSLSECESLRSGTPVKSEISGTGSVSGYGTGGDSGSDKTPPYLPTSKNCHYATLGHPGKFMLMNDNNLHPEK